MYEGISNILDLLNILGHLGQSCFTDEDIETLETEHVPSRMARKYIPVLGTSFPIFLVTRPLLQNNSPIKTKTKTAKTSWLYLGVEMWGGMRAKVSDSQHNLRRKSLYESPQRTLKLTQRHIEN